MSAALLDLPALRAHIAVAAGALASAAVLAQRCIADPDRIGRGTASAALAGLAAACIALL